MKRPYLLFDAGGTLLFPDPGVLSSLAREQGLAISERQFYDAHFQAIHSIDTLLRAGGPILPWSFERFITTMAQCAGVDERPAALIAERLAERHRTISAWTFTFSWVGETLDRLRGEGYRMSVVSNSDGRVRTQLTAVGIAKFFEEIFDSAIVGFEKPDPRIFCHALSHLSLSARDALYVGDVYHLDVLGANGAGLGCVHLDPLNLYEGWPGTRLPDIRHLPDWLIAYDKDFVGHAPSLGDGGTARVFPE